MQGIAGKMSQLAARKLLIEALARQLDRYAWSFKCRVNPTSQYGIRQQKTLRKSTRILGGVDAFLKSYRHAVICKPE